MSSKTTLTERITAIVMEKGINIGLIIIEISLLIFLSLVIYKTQISMDETLDKLEALDMGQAIKKVKEAADRAEQAADRAEKAATAMTTASGETSKAATAMTTASGETSKAATAMTTASGETSNAAKAMTTASGETSNAAKAMTTASGIARGAVVTMTTASIEADAAAKVAQVTSKKFAEISNNLNIKMNQLSAIALKNGEKWQGLKIASENRCESYSRRLYPHNRKAIQRNIQEYSSVIYTPYSDKFLQSPNGINIDHIVSTSEAHDSGMCDLDTYARINTGMRTMKDLVKTRSDLANDRKNLVLASTHINRYFKQGKDAGEWLPEHNKCWFAWRVVQVKKSYGLTVDIKEATALRNLWNSCELDKDKEPLLPPAVEK